MCEISFKIIWSNFSNSACILLLLNLKGIWWSNPYESAVCSSVSWYDEKLWPVFLMHVVNDLSISLSCCFCKSAAFFSWRFDITLNLFFKAMFNPNQTGGSEKWLPGIFCFLVTNPNLMKLGDFLRFIFWNFFQNSNWFLQFRNVCTTRCYFFCISSVRKMNISLEILLVFQSRRFRKNFYWLF